MKEIVINNPKQNLNKLLIVGHEYSNYESIEKLLNKNGMQNASKLKKEDIEAKQISKIIQKTNNTNSSGQVEVNPMWNGLAMDLFISNIDHDFWGWADCDAISLLNYWKSVDNNLAFVLVYSTPEYLLKKIFEKNNTKLTKEELEVQIENWSKYNRKLLDFFYRNNDNSILVNSEQVGQNSIEYIEELKKQLSISSVSSQEIIELNIENNTYQEDSTLNYLVEQIIEENNVLKNMYEELQSCANFPNITKSKKDISIINTLIEYKEKEKEKLEESKIQIEKINSLINDKNKNELLIKSKEEKTNELKEENKLLLNQLFAVQEELEKLFTKDKNNEEKISNLINDKNKNEQLIKSKEKKINELKEENELLLNQLFAVQEELEKYYLELESIKKQKKEPKRHFGAANRIKQQLSYRLGSTMIDNSKSLSGLISLPFKLREETKIYRKEQKNKKNLPALHTYADYYEAERLKNHLSYKLGYEMIQCFKSPLGIFTWPWAIKKARKEYKEGRKNV